jgi:hypothetical protein
MLHMHFVYILFHIASYAAQRMGARRALLILAQAWGGWQWVYARHQRYAQRLAKMEGSLVQRRILSLLHTVCLELWLLVLRLRLCRQAAQVLAGKKERAVWRDTWQRWCWVRWQRGRHLLRLRSVAYLVLKRERGVLGVAFEAFGALLCLASCRLRALKLRFRAACREAWHHWLCRVGWRRVSVRYDTIRVCAV